MGMVLIRPMRMVMILLGVKGMIRILMGVMGMSRGVWGGGLMGFFNLELYLVQIASLNHISKNVLSSDLWRVQFCHNLTGLFKMHSDMRGFP